MFLSSNFRSGGGGPLFDAAVAGRSYHGRQTITQQRLVKKMARIPDQVLANAVDVKTTTILVSLTMLVQTLRVDRVADQTTKSVVG